MAVWIILIPSLITALACVAGRTTIFIRRASFIGSLISFALCGFVSLQLLSGQSMDTGPGIFFDALGAYLAVIISALSLVASHSSGNFMEHESRAENLGIGAWRTYFGLFHLFVSTMLTISIANNLGLLWIMIEATTLSSAFLVGFHRHRHSIEAAWKYVILCSIGIAFALFGTILFYYAAMQGGNGHHLDWTSFMAIAPKLNPKLVKLAFLFVALGYGTKAGLAPLHTWLPDAHSQAPSPVSAMLSGVLLTSAFYALVRFYALTVRCVGPAYPGIILIFFGLASLAIAAPFIIAARDYKRMLAYSSVEHMGFMAFGLGLGSPLAIYGAFLHVLFHALAKGIAFLSAGRILNAFGTRKISKVSGAVTVLPQAGIPFFAALLGLAGLPPFGIFTSELMVLSAGFSSGRRRISSMTLALLALIFAGLLYHGIQICFGQRSNKLAATKSHSDAAWTILAALALLALMVFGCWIPDSLDVWISEIVRIVQGQSHV